MKKESKSSFNSDFVVGGLSSSVGAVAGMVAGSMLSTSAAGASENPGEGVVSPDPVSVHTSGPDPVSNPGQTEGPAVSDDNPGIEFHGYGTVSNLDGSQMDVAVVSVNGQEAVIVDVDRDSMADYLASDVNANGLLEDGEIMDISGEKISMEPFREAVMDDNQLLAQDELEDGEIMDVSDEKISMEPFQESVMDGDQLLAQDADYENNANVDDYMA